jgi:hypothetical protein
MRECTGIPLSRAGSNSGPYEPCLLLVSESETVKRINEYTAKPKTVLEEAAGLVDGEREKEYGHPIDDFGAVSRAAMALKVFPENGPLEHALYMVLVKIQRLVQTPDHRDSIVDGAGYFRTYEKVLERMQDA